MSFSHPADDVFEQSPHPHETGGGNDHDSASPSRRRSSDGSTSGQRRHSRDGGGARASSGHGGTGSSTSRPRHEDKANAARDDKAKADDDKDSGTINHPAAMEHPSMVGDNVSDDGRPLWVPAGAGGMRDDMHGRMPWGGYDGGMGHEDNGGVDDEDDDEDEDDDAPQENRELPVMADLQWGHPVRIVGSMMSGMEQLYVCPHCKDVINRYGRLTQCKHTYCAACAEKVQTLKSPCWLCVAFHFDNPPGSSGSRPLVDYFGLDQQMFICQAAKKADRPCGRGFLSEETMQACRHTIRSAHTLLGKGPRPGHTAVSETRAHDHVRYDRPPPRDQPDYYASRGSADYAPQARASGGPPPLRYRPTSRDSHSRYDGYDGGYSEQPRPVAYGRQSYPSEPYSSQTDTYARDASYEARMYQRDDRHYRPWPEGSGDDRHPSRHREALPWDAQDPSPSGLNQHPAHF
eukprot:m.120151 g.120151  ORF g.120151 m.120151 type:complete len:461 (-) comp11050_c0_seq2:2259-3641(-)